LNEVQAPSPKFENALKKVVNIPSHVSTALEGLVLLYEVPQSHSGTPHAVGVLWTMDRPVAETTHNTQK